MGLGLWGSAAFGSDALASDATDVPTLDFAGPFAGSGGRDAAVEGGTEATEVVTFGTTR